MRGDPLRFLSSEALNEMALLIGAGGGEGLPGAEKLDPWEKLRKLAREAEKAEQAARDSGDPELLEKDERARQALQDATVAGGEAREALEKAKARHKLLGTADSQKAVYAAEDAFTEAVRKFNRKSYAAMKARQAREAAEDPKKRKAADEAYKRYREYADDWLDLFERLTRNQWRWWPWPHAEKLSPGR